ncbi:MAG: hypothetical protein KBT36_14025 [Kurthia sp.]|nr:hypothetical protein [Candidatus Kurthia equi]
MRAEQLRLGNWVYDDMNNMVKVDHQDIGEELYIFYKPIPLTEEILLKCGFLNLPILDNHFYVKGMLILKRDETFIHDKTGVELKYLHQLQNLIYALTQQDLNIKL